MDGATAAAVLGVAQGATRREIVRAFRARAKQVHPDAAGTDEAFVIVRAAFDHLLASTAAGPAAMAPAPPTGPRPTGRAANGWVRAGGPRAATAIDLTDSPLARRPATASATATSTATVEPAGRRFEECLRAELARPTR